MTDRQLLYDRYVAFKGWGEEGRDSADEFATLLGFSRKIAPYRLLEIGFGRGDLLDWARAQGIETHGVEIIPELVKRAQERGHSVSASGLGQLRTGDFDVVVAVDVLEHFTLAELQDFLTQVRRVLCPDGVFIARFPNGQSPFSGLFQHGDLTHTLQLTPNALRQLAAPAGLSLGGAYNCRPLGRGFTTLKRRLAYLVRDFVETIVGYVYFGHRIPLDPNVVAVLHRAEP